MNRERNVNRLGRSRAMIVSVLLHVLVLLGLGGGRFPVPAPEPGVMAVYLAMPAAVPERAWDQQANPEKKAVAQPTKARPVSPASEESRIVASQPLVPEATPDEKPKSEPVPVQEIKVEKQAETISEVVERASLDEIPDPVPAAGSDIDNGQNESLSQNSSAFANAIRTATADREPRTQNSTNAMLAFVGDPASLGMFVSDAPGPDLVETVIVSLPEPVYPVLSRKRGEEGRVIIQVEISAEGKVLKALVTSSSSYPRLDGAALKAIQGAAFTPATEYGVPVESTTTLAYRFELEGK